MPKDHPVKGILFIICAIFLFASSDALSKYLVGFYPVILVLWVRYVVHTLAMLAVFGPRSGLALIRTKRPRLQLMRGLCMASTNILFISALRYIPLAEGTAIVYLTPLIVTALSAPLLHEHVTRRQWIAVIIGFIGVIIVVRPGGSMFTPVALLALASAFSFSCYQIITRKLTGIDSSTTSNFLSGVISTIVTSAILPFFWQVPSLHFALLMIALGISALTSHLLMTQAYHYAKPSTLAPFTYGQLLFAGLIGYALFGHIPDAYALLGISIICISGLMVAWSHRRG